MRVIRYAPALLWVVAIGACVNPEPAHPLVGTWEQLRAEAFLVDSTVTWNIAERPPEFRPVKIVSATHFAYLHPGSGGDSLLHAGKGHVEVNVLDNTYTEQIHFHVVPGLTGSSIRFSFRLDGDLWYHIRHDTPVWEEARGLNGGKETYRHVEIWERKH